MREQGDAGTRDAGPLRIVAVVVGEVTAPQLWALKALATSAYDMRVVRVGPDAVGRRLRAGGLAAAIAERELRRQDTQLDRLFDAAPLRDWLAQSGIVVTEVATLAESEMRHVLAEVVPDVIVSLAGLEPVRALAPLARRATLALALATAAADAERLTILRGIIEGHAAWVGASIHALDDGGATPRLVWRARPQLAPGDSGDEVVFRAQVEAVTGLLALLDGYAQNRRPATVAQNGTDVAGPGLWTWTRYVVSGRGRTALPACERALQ